MAFCKKCGAPLSVTERIPAGYSSRSGKKLFHDVTSCPNRPRTFMQKVLRWEWGHEHYTTFFPVTEDGEQEFFG